MSHRDWPGGHVTVLGLRVTRRHGAGPDPGPTEPVGVTLPVGRGTSGPRLRLVTVTGVTAGSLSLASGTVAR